MRLKKFEISNYRSCLKSVLDINHDMMCLIGVNGVGKTNLLNGIQLLKRIEGQRSALMRRSKTGALNADISIVLEHDEKLIRIKGEIFYETDDRNTDEVFYANLRFNLSEFTGNKKWISVPGEFFSFVYEKNPNIYSFLKYLKVKLTTKEIEVLGIVKEFIKRISYYSASQFSDATKCPISFELEENKPYRSNRFNMYHEKFLGDLYLNSKNNKKLFNKFLSTVNKEGIGLIENISFSEYDMPSNSYEVKSGGKLKTIERNRQLIIPFVTIDNIQLSPNQLSEGTFKTLALIFYIITDDNELLLIEEPEVCVHHGLLNSIVSLILSQSLKKQIIISTHSDFVLDRLKPDNLLIVTKEYEKGTIARPLNKALAKNDFNALKQYLSETGNLGEYWKEGGFDNE